jgi:tripartite-type tricarboxylate transporter receptor subunit TctC
MKNIIKSYIYEIIFSCAALLMGVPAALAQEYPAKPIRVVVPFPPGGGTDFMGRVIMQKVGENLGATVVIDNRGGAGSSIGTEIVARSPADGYTVLIVSGAHAINPSIYPKLPYDSVRDFAPVTMFTSGPGLLVVHPSVPAKSVRELIALAKSRPGQLNYASAGIGTPPHLAGELFKTMARVNIVHVPYKGNGPAYTDLIGGHVSVMFPNVSTATAHVRAGKLRALAVTTKSRTPIAPDLPTISEAGVPGYDVSSWYGLLAPAGTPAAVVAKLQREIARVMRLPDVSEKLTSQGLDIVGNTPEEFAAIIKAEIVKWAKVVKASGAKAD